jgi:hypothetical protein
LVQGNKNGALVGKVLINRANADAGNLGDAVRRDGGQAFALEQPDDGLKHRVESLTRAPLLRSSPDEISWRFYRHRNSTYVIKYEYSSY